MADAEDTPNTGTDKRVEEVAKLKRDLQGPLGLIQKYEDASPEEKENYEDSISKAYNDRRLLEEEIRKAGTPEGARDFGPLRIEWKVKEPSVVNVRLSEGQEPPQDFDLREDQATPNAGRMFSTRRFAYHHTNGYFTIYFPLGDEPGVLGVSVFYRDGATGSDAGGVLAVW